MRNQYLRYLVYIALCVGSVTALAAENTVKTITVGQTIAWDGIKAPYGGKIKITVKQGYELQEAFGKGEEPFIDIDDFAGEALADGLYWYQIVPNTAQIQLSKKQRDSIPFEQRGLIDVAEVFELGSDDLSPFSSAFRVQKGQLIDQHQTEK